MKHILIWGIFTAILAIIMLSFVSANFQNPAHFLKVQNKTILTDKQDLISNSNFLLSESTNNINVIWPEAGYYYTTDFMDLFITTNINSVCDYSFNGGEFYKMDDTGKVNHTQRLLMLKDNMDSNAYIVNFKCTDISNNELTASNYFWINVTNLDKYFLRNDLGSWTYGGSDLSWSGNENGILEFYEGEYEQEQTNLYDSLILDIFDSENSTRNILKNILNSPDHNISIRIIEGRRVYVSEEEGFKEMFWNSENKLIAHAIFAYGNSTPVVIDYPMEVIIPYLQKYPGTLIEFCSPNWTKEDNNCQITDKKLISYSNDCEIDGKIPSDNGTYTYCNYCSQNIQGPLYTNWSICSSNGMQTRVKYYVDTNYTNCCTLTELSSDCGIKDSKYNNITEDSSCNSFVLTLNTPNKELYNISSLSLKINSSIKLNKLDYIDYSQKNSKWTNLCKNCYGYDKIIRFSDGLHNLSIRANSTEGQFLFANVSFFIDTNFPKISTTEPKNKEFTNGSDFFIKYSEDNLKEITLVYGSDTLTKEDCPSGRNKNCSFNVDLGEYEGKIISYNFKINDIANNIRVSKNTSILVDTTSPIISKFNYSINGKYVTINITINETNFKVISFIDLNDPKSKMKSLCSNLKNSGCLTKSLFKSGDYNLKIQVLDKAGNSAEKLISFKV